MNKYILPLLFVLSFMSNELQAKTIYISPKGDDKVNNGSFAAPFASLMRAQELVVAGDTVYMRGGTYLIDESQIAEQNRGYAIVHLLKKSGTSTHPISYLAFKGEKVVFDLSKVKPLDARVTVFLVKGSWLHLKGFEVVGTQVTQQGHTQSECFRNEGSNNLYEQLSMHDGMAIGFYLTNGSNNLILNCDAYRNWDTVSENGKGGNADGFGCHPALGAMGNVFRGCRAWFNSDDGYDCISASESVTFDHCWAFYNGLSPTFASLADGNGFKAGGWGKKPVSKIPKIVPGHLIQFCLAVGNKANGFYSNHQIAGSKWYNNTAYKNSINYNMLNRLKDNLTDVPGYDHILTNNLSFGARDTIHIEVKRCKIDHNSFTLPLKVSANEFQSLDVSQLTLPRSNDGSLPAITLLQLKKESPFIDKGVDIGFPYQGKAPDLGAFESTFVGK